MVIGVGSNLLVRDGGVPGVVIRLARGFDEIEPLRRNEDQRRRGRARCEASPRQRLRRGSRASPSTAAFRAPSAARCA